MLLKVFKVFKVRWGPCLGADTPSPAGRLNPTDVQQSPHKALPELLLPTLSSSDAYTQFACAVESRWSLSNCKSKSTILHSSLFGSPRQSELTFPSSLKQRRIYAACVFGVESRQGILQISSFDRCLELTKQHGGKAQWICS